MTTIQTKGNAGRDSEGQQRMDRGTSSQSTVTRTWLSGPRGGSAEPRELTGQMAVQVTGKGVCAEVPGEVGTQAGKSGRGAGTEEVEGKREVE